MTIPVGTRPVTIGDVILEEAYEFLDELRASTEINMYTAAPILRQEFECDRDSGNQILKAWMEDF